MLESTMFIRLLITFVMAFLFGFERQKSHKQVGFGTFIFVSVGSCAMALVSLTLVQENPLPLLGAILTGIGFLGAGALIRDHDKIFGFTTAASIWAFAIIGVSIGVGDYFVGSIFYFFIWCVVIFDKYLEKRGIGSYRKRLTINAKKIVSEQEVRNFLNNIGIKKTKLMSMEFSKGENKVSFMYFVEGDSANIKKIPQEALKNNWLDSFELE